MHLKVTLGKKKNENNNTNVKGREKRTCDLGW